MSLELAIVIGGYLAEWGTVKLADKLLAGVGSKLNTQELDKALKAGITAAHEREKTLFYPCPPHLIPGFLDGIFKDVGIQELQKPLLDQGMPQVPFLVEAFKTALKERPKVKVYEDKIEPWLRVFANTYFEKTRNYLRFQVAKEDYLKQLADWFDDVKFAGIEVAGQEVEKSAKLAQIFVMPDVVEEIQGQEVASFNRDLNLDGTLSNRQTQLLWEQRQKSRLGEDSGRKFSAQHLLVENTSHKFVLLGAPGSGKTTLMSYFAVILAQKQPQQLALAADTEWLPILIRIRDLSRRTDISFLEYIHQFVLNNLSVKDLPSGFFEYWLEDGRALILLDGLDEVADPAKRDDVVRKIECFLGQFHKNRAIITSRPAGYRRDFFHMEAFPHYTLQLFDELKIDLFVKQWYVSRFKDPDEAQRRQENLKKALSEQDRIKLLARNPLLLTIISLIHRYEAHLPRQRYKLYERAVQTLLTAWDSGKEIDYKWPLEYLNRDDIERLMQRLAYWIHTQGGTGDKEGGTLIDRDELISQLSTYITEQKRIKRHQAKKEAKRLVEHIRDRTGLLNEQGQDCYAFVHKTFQEYLAAEDIRYRQEDEDFEIVLEHIQKYLHNSHWQEVLLLLIAQQKPKKATRVLEEILQQRSPYEQWLHRDLFFAGRCLAEDLEVSNDNLVAGILQQLVELETSGSRPVRDIISYQVVQTICSLNETRYAAKALELLNNSKNRLDPAQMQVYRVKLGEKEKALATLLQLLQDQDPDVRYKTAYALGTLGDTSQPVIQALLTLLQDQDSQVRGQAASALGDLGEVGEPEIQVILDLLKDNDAKVRGNAALALGKLKNTTDVVIESLMKLLQDRDSDVRGRAALALGSLGNAEKSVIIIPSLLDLLPKIEEANELGRLGYALGKLEKASGSVIPALLDLLDHQDANVRGRAALVLGDLGDASEPVIQALRNLLHDRDASVHSRAALALGDLGDTSEPVIQSIVILLQDKDADVRGRAALALGDLRNGSELVIQSIVTLLQDPDPDVRYRATSALGKLGNDSEFVIQSILNLLEDETDFLRHRAVYVLNMLGNASNQVTDAVAEWILQHPNSIGIHDGINVLWNLVAEGQN